MDTLLFLPLWARTTNEHEVGYLNKTDETAERSRVLKPPVKGLIGTQHGGIDTAACYN